MLLMYVRHLRIYPDLQRGIDDPVTGREGHFCMRIIEGYKLSVQNILALQKEECAHIIAKMALFAISLSTVSEDPVLLNSNDIVSYYAKEGYAHETLLHVQRYLHEIKMEQKVSVTLVAMSLKLGWDLVQEMEQNNHPGERD